MADKKGQKESEPQLDVVIKESGEEAEKKFNKRTKELIGSNIKAIQKGKFVEEGVKAEFKDDVARLMTANQIELNKMKQSQAQAKQSVTSQYESAKKEIRKKHKEELAELHNRYANVLKGYGSREGEKRKIDTKSEVYDFVRFGFSMLKNMNLPELVNSVSQEMVYDKADERDKHMFEVIDKLAEGKDLEEGDYVNIAERMTNLAEMDLSKLTIDGKDLDASMDSLARTSVLSAGMLLNEGQRFELAKTLTAKHGEKGAKIIHELTKIGYFSVLQTEAIFENHYTVEGEARAMYKSAIADQTYIKGQEEMVKMKEQGIENLEKFFHTNFAQGYLSYKNVINYEIVARAALAVAVINFVINAKNKDPEAILLNAPMWAGLGIGAYIADDVTHGGVRRLATRDSKEEKEKKAKDAKAEAFEKSFSSKPQLGRWFTDNLGAINDGFEKVNPKKENENYHITFASMGLSSPGRKDGIDNTALLETTISQWHRQLYFDVKQKDPIAQKQYIETEILNEQIV